MRKARTAWDDRQIVGAIVAAAFAGVLVFAVAFALVPFVEGARENLLTSVGTAGLGLSCGAIIGGGISELFKALERGRVERASEQAFYQSVLDDVKQAYDIVEKAKLLIEAHKSAKTYGEQMRELPNADILLHNIRRALRPRYPEVEADIKPSLDACSRFIKALTAEFRREYKAISNLQLCDEKVNEARRKALGTGPMPAGGLTFDDAAWQKIVALPALRVLRDEALWPMYYVTFRWHIDAASFHLRKRLDGGQTTDAARQWAALRAEFDRKSAQVNRLRRRVSGASLAWRAITFRMPAPRSRPGSVPSPRPRRSS